MFLFLALLAFQAKSAQHCSEYVVAYNSGDIKNIWGTFMNAMYGMPTVIKDEYELKFLNLDAKSKITILESVLEECSVTQSNENLETVIKKVM